MLYSKSLHTEPGRKAIALFFMVLLFFVYTVEAIHHHKEKSYTFQTEYSFTESNSQCWICDQLQHQSHELIHPGLTQLPKTPVFDGFETDISYLFPVYSFIKFISPNKDPPFGIPF